MKKFLVIMACITFFAVSGLAAAKTGAGAMGPAPNSGDCVADGSGFDTPNGPNGTGTEGSGNGPMGPAPNTGDGVPDGSGFDGPNG